MVLPPIGLMYRSGQLLEQNFEVAPVADHPSEWFSEPLRSSQESHFCACAGFSHFTLIGGHRSLSTSVCHTSMQQEQKVSKKKIISKLTSRPCRSMSNVFQTWFCVLEMRCFCENGIFSFLQFSIFFLQGHSFHIFWDIFRLFPIHLLHYFNCEHVHLTILLCSFQKHFPLCSE